MSVRRFFLHGIGGVYNYGCEAIVRGTLAILRHEWPDCRVLYLSRRPVADREALNGCDLEVLDCSLPPRWSPRRALRGSLRRLGVPFEWISRERLPDLPAEDCVLSIGGDIYTLGPPPYRSSPHTDKVRTAERIMSTGCRWVLWGASVGPFDAWPDSLPYFKRILERAALIAVREPWTERYLARIGIAQNVVPVADPAFAMDGTYQEGDFPFAKDQSLVVGVNLSPLSAYYVGGAGALRQAVREQASFLCRIIERYDVRLLLIPHVIAPHSKLDDDYRHLEGVLANIGAPLAERVALLPPGLGARRTKGVIAKCDALLAARMHCAIAGVSSGVPTLLLSYSTKSRGMAEYVYGDEGAIFCQDVAVLHEPAAARILEPLLQRRLDIAQRLASASSSWAAQAISAASELRRRCYCREVYGG